MFHQKWDHADAIALTDEEGKVNSSKAVHKAYLSYRRWFEEVRTTGFAAAREAKLEPLRGEKTRWY